MSEFMCESCKYGKTRNIDLLTGDIIILCDNYKMVFVEDIEEEAKHCRCFERDDE